MVAENKHSKKEGGKGALRKDIGALSDQKEDNQVNKNKSIKLLTYEILEIWDSLKTSN